jgi:hypothetical protein
MGGRFWRGMGLHLEDVYMELKSFCWEFRTVLIMVIIREKDI